MNIREANAPELVKVWQVITGASVLGGRDAHIIREMLDHGYTPAQLVQAMRDYNEMDWTKSIYWFERRIEEVVEMDNLVAETRLCEWLTGRLAPHAFLIYMDFREGFGGIPQTGLVAAYDKARSELEAWVDDTISNSTFYSRTGIARVLGKRARAAR